MWYSYYFKKFAMIKTSQEYWVDDLGMTFFADGDIGDQNHAGVIIDQILYSHDIDPTIENVDAMTNEELLERGLSQEELNYVRGNLDPRDYGMKYLGWARIVGTTAQVYTISPRILSNLASGWYDIFGEEAMNLTYTIEVGPPGQSVVYEDIPWEVIDSEDISQLYAYSEVKRR
jgi:hypothetical protein